MKHSCSILFCALLLSACTSLKKLQSVDTIVPCLGSVGEVKVSMFSKEFQKVGEPLVSINIGASLQSKAFTNASYKAYKKYCENLGKSLSITFADSMEITPRFYQLNITDRVGMKKMLNHENNTALLQYLKDDKSIQMLTSISFVMEKGQQQGLEDAEHIMLVQKNGHLVCELHSKTGERELNMKSLAAFDFSTSEFCWKNNRYGKPQIALLLPNGSSCPSSMEKSAEKLNDTKSYVKF